MLTLKRFDLKAQVWSEETEVRPVEYKNTLLERLYPDTEFAIGDVSGFVKCDKPDLDSAIAALTAGFDGFKIVGASGSRKKGYALFARTDAALFERFFGSTSNAINYGSNLVTECSMTCEYKSLKILVVEDGEYGTGDCHAKCSPWFAIASTGGLQRPFQFRAAVKAKQSWVAKGTIAFSFGLTEYDLILPVSCFKGNKVKPGVYSPKILYFGVVHEAEVRHVNMSYSVTQYLPWSAIESDILPGTLAQARKLSYLQSNVRELATFLTSGTGIDLDEDEESYVSPLAEIVAADVHGQLVQHPWVVRQVRETVRKRWLRLATAGAMQFQSCMTMPDDDLPANTVCIPHLPEGEVIVFPYPCRWKWDLKVWNNVHSAKWRDYEGIVAGSHSTMLELGRDFDGDFLQFLPANLLPNVAAAIKEFEPTPELIKPKKEKIDGSLSEIAVRSMDNAVGLITYLIAKSWASKHHSFIPRLAQELQIEVDSLKNVARADRKYIADIGKSLAEYPCSWLKDHKEPDVFMTRPIKTGGTDAISRLADAVNAVWQPLQLKERSLQEFRSFFSYEMPDGWEDKARLRRDEYFQQMKAAANDKNQMIKIIADYKEKAIAIPSHQMPAAVTAWWHAFHMQKSGTASILFHMFKEQIIQQLRAFQFVKFTIVGQKYNAFAGFAWNGDYYSVQVVDADDKQAVYIDDYLLGYLAKDAPKYTSGSVIDVALHSYKQSIMATVIG